MRKSTRIINEINYRKFSSTGGNIIENQIINFQSDTQLPKDGSGDFPNKTNIERLR